MRASSSLFFGSSLCVLFSFALVVELRVHNLLAGGWLVLLLFGHVPFGALPWHLRSLPLVVRSKWSGSEVFNVTGGAYLCMLRASEHLGVFRQSKGR